jgi:DNA repair exonuclease SbcCD ATPase subunit
VITPELQAALDDCAEYDRLVRQLSRARAEESRALEALRSANAAVQADEHDVDSLESFSPTRIWAALHGTRSSRLDRERAELAATKHTASAAEDVLAIATAAREQVETALRAMGDVKQRRADALTVEETRLRTTGGAASAQLLEISEQLASVRAQLRELTEAQSAAQDARGSLEDAAANLGGAEDLAEIDIFLRGGFLTDMAKYDRMDAATKSLRAADGNLRRLSAELADVGLSSVGGIEVDELTQTFDVWFDNIFTDWSVRQRIVAAADRTARATAAVDAAAGRLAQRGRELEALRATLTAARERVILGG